MASKKKLSLKEFYADATLGGGNNWADDDIDLSSISVPIIQNNHQHYHEDYLNYQSNSRQTFSSNNHQFGNYPKSPPFIVKFTNIPSHFGSEHIEDLFVSRFMKYIKFKLFWELNHEEMGLANNPESLINKRKKVAFVELHDLKDFEKVLRWNDLFLGPLHGKVQVNVGNFGDFQTYNDLNQKLAESDDPSVSFIHKRERRQSFNDDRGHQNNHSNGHPPRQSRFYGKSPELNHQRPQLHQPHPEPPKELPPLMEPKPAPPAKKSNPFGSAKPVDTLSRQLEIEKKLHDLEINKTTFKTLGHDEVQEQKKPAHAPVQQSGTAFTQTATNPQVQHNTALGSKASTPQHSHLKLSQPASPKKKELKPAAPPEVGAWKIKQPVNNNSKESELPPKVPTPVSADVFQSNKKSSQSNNKDKSETSGSTKPKVLLKRKVPDSRKHPEGGRFVRRESITQKEKNEATEPTLHASKEDTKKVPEIKPKEKRKSEETSEANDIAPKENTKPATQKKKSNNTIRQKKNKSPPKPEEPAIISTESEQPKERSNSNKKKEKENLKPDDPSIPKPDTSTDLHGRKIYHNVSYVKKKSVDETKNGSIKSEKEKVKETETPKERQEDKDPLKEVVDLNDELVADGEFSVSRGRGRGRGGRGRGSGTRGRGRGGSIRSRKTSVEETPKVEETDVKLKSKSASKSPKPEPTKQSNGTNKPNDTPSEPQRDKPETATDDKKPNDRPSTRGSRGGFRGRRGGRGHFHNVNRTFNKSKDKDANQSEKAT